MSIEKLQVKATEIRRDIIAMLGEAGSGHPGGSLSAADIVTALYFSVLNIDHKNPRREDRDRFVLSKGHAAPLLYSALAERGYFPKDELMSLRKFGSRLQGHPKIGSPPGVEISSGSLGQGLSVANGMAMAGKLDGKDYRVYALLGDGEIEEGQIWEAAMTAAHYKLDNLCAILDFNGLQIDGPIVEVMNSNPIREKWTAFRWNTMEIDGHNFEEILRAFEEAKKIKGKPTIIIAHTIKGKGVSFMENVVDFHGKAPTKEQTRQALGELS
ncbi:transketolase [bacterium]|nr:transketolase [bacterium]